MNCLLGVGLDTDHQIPGTFSTQIFWSWIITVPMTPALNVQLHFLASSILIQLFRRQRSLLSGCYSSQQWVLGLVTGTGVGGEISEFSQLQNEELSWRTDLEIVRRRLLCSQRQRCGHGCICNIFDSPGLGCWSYLWQADLWNQSNPSKSWVWSVWGWFLAWLFSPPFWGIEIAWTPPHHNWCYFLNWASPLFLRIIK